MKRVGLSILAFAAIFVALAPADAGDCYVSRAVTYQAATVVYAPPIYAVPVLAVQAYSAGYVGDVAGSRQIEELRDSIRELRSAFLSQPQSPPPPPPQIAPVPQQQAFGKVDIRTYFMNRCAECHDATTAKVKGDGIVLTRDNAIVEMDCVLATACLAEVLEGSMPKKGPKATPLEKRAMTLFAREVAAKAASNRIPQQLPPAPAVPQSDVKREGTRIFRLALE